MSIGPSPYPVFAWPVLCTGASLTVDVVTGGGSNVETCNFSSGSPWGWRTQTGIANTNTATTDSLAEYISDALVAHTLITATVLTYPRYSSGQSDAFPKYDIRVASATALSISITGSSGVTAAQLGFPAWPVNLTAIGGGNWQLINTQCTDGVYSCVTDCTETTYDRTQIATQRFAALSNAARVNVHTGSAQKLSRSYRMLKVARRFVERRYAAQTLDATQAGTLTTDTYGTLDRLIIAAAGGNNVLVNEGDLDATECALQFGTDPKVTDYATPTSIGGRRYEVTLPFSEV